MTDKKLSPGVASAVIAVVLAGAASIEWRAMVRVKDRRDRAPAKMTAQMCQSCHSDARMLAAMKAKQGAHNTAPVFLPILKPASHPNLATGSWPIK